MVWIHQQCPGKYVLRKRRNWFVCCYEIWKRWQNELSIVCQSRHIADECVSEFHSRFNAVYHYLIMSDHIDVYVHSFKIHFSQQTINYKPLPEAIVPANVSSFYRETKVNIKSYFLFTRVQEFWAYIGFRLIVIF